MRCAVGLLAVLLLSAFGSAQQNPPKFTARTELVTVPVVVTRGGNHVSGLKKEDFSVLEDGKPRTVAFFEEVEVAPAKLRHAAPPAGNFTNAVEGTDRPAGLTIILMDRLLTPYLEQNNAKAEILKFLSLNAEQRVPTMLAVLDHKGLRVVHGFTSSSETLAAVLKRVPGTQREIPLKQSDLDELNALKAGPGIAGIIDPTKAQPDTDSLLNINREVMDMNSLFSPNVVDPLTREKDRRRIDAIELELLVFEQLSRGLSAIPGRKTLIWSSPGFECPFLAPMILNLKGEYVPMGQMCVNTWRALSAANVAVYQVNPVQTEIGTMQREMMNQSLTAYTGGKVCSSRNDLDACYRTAVEDSYRYYMLSYYGTPTQKPTWRKIQVKVNAEKVDVHTRSGYMTAGSEKSFERDRKTDVAIAVVSPLDYTGLPLTVTWTKTEEGSGKKKYGFQIRVAPKALTIDDADENHLKLNIVALAMDAESKRVGDVTQTVEAHLKDTSVTQIQNAGFLYRGTLEVPAGDYQVKFIVRDDLSGKMGTVTAPTPKEGS